MKISLHELTIHDDPVSLQTTSVVIVWSIGSLHEEHDQQKKALECKIKQLNNMKAIAKTTNLRILNFISIFKSLQNYHLLNPKIKKIL